MKYADSQKCPQCRSSLQPGLGQCGTCGLALTTAEVTALWETLLKADQQLALAMDASTVGSSAALDEAGPLPLQPAPKHTTPKIDTASVLLILGALFVLVAGGIASALALGVFALPLMTLVAGGMAYYADHRNLMS